jgi:hypothetical protein
MNTKNSITILSYGLSGGLFLSSFVLIFELFDERNNQSAMTPIVMVLAGFFFLQWMNWNKSNDEDTLALAEMRIVAACIFMAVFASFGFLITFSDYWLAKETRYFCIALGLPILFAFIYRAFAIKRTKASRNL